tara:strand:+ start:2809 stop:3360 length:552 start_codon:yes stop_codon:yes gene_type:complete
VKFTELPLEGSYFIELESFEDNRGAFSRIFCQDEFNKIDHSKNLVQINYSMTVKKGTVRGMHYQTPPMSEVKIVTCLSGSIYDVIIDLRKGSSTFMHWHGKTLSGDNKYMLYIPEGFAHGFQALQNNCELLYFHTEFYNPDFEATINYNDSNIGIEWPLGVTEISEKDKNCPQLPKNFSGIII